jgi:acylphosphatase
MAERQVMYCRVRGRVQGVGFRYFVQEQAATLGLAGSVRNCRDGSVEMEARGPSDALDRLLEAVQRGPRGAHVTGCEVTRGVIPSEPEGADKRAAFRIGY